MEVKRRNIVLVCRLVLTAQTNTTVRDWHWTVNFRHLSLYVLHASSYSRIQIYIYRVHCLPLPGRHWLHGYTYSKTKWGAYDLKNP